MSLVLGCLGGVVCLFSFPQVIVDLELMDSDED